MSRPCKQRRGSGEPTTADNGSTKSNPRLNDKEKKSETPAPSQTSAPVSAVKDSAPLSEIPDDDERKSAASTRPSLSPGCPVVIRGRNLKGTGLNSRRGIISGVETNGRFPVDIDSGDRTVMVKRKNLHIEGDAESSRASTKPVRAELKIRDVEAGSGSVVRRGSRVTVRYHGLLTNGKVFDTCLKRGKPFSFVVGRGDVIRGWDRGVLGMKQGGKRKLMVPSHLGYGRRGVASGRVPIPPNATLLFEIHVLDVV